jgi:hypothetical protein
MQIRFYQCGGWVFDFINTRRFWAFEKKSGSKNTTGSRYFEKKFRFKEPLVLGTLKKKIRFKEPLVLGTMKNKSDSKNRWFWVL